MEGKQEKPCGSACVFTCVWEVSLYASYTAVVTAGFLRTFRELTCVGRLREGDTVCRAPACGGCEAFVLLEHPLDVY